MTPMTTAEGVAFLRTPDANFAGLEDFPHPARWREFQGLRHAYVEAGPADGPVALLMHGMPTWGYLNRKIMARLVAEGWRCIAPDHIGFGRSDKPVDEAWYSIGRHAEAHAALVEGLDLSEVTLFCQDWGGPIGLSHVAADPGRYARLVVMNTWLHHDGYEYTEALRRWNAQWKPDGVFGQNVPEKLSLGWFMMVATRRMEAREMYAIVETGAYPHLGAGDLAVRRAYDAPFDGLGRPGHSGPRRFPLSLPFDNPEGGAAAAQARWYEALLGWTKPIQFIWGGQDNVFTEAWGRTWAARYPQATFDLIPEAAHFLQDTHGDRIAETFLQRRAEG